MYPLDRYRQIQYYLLSCISGITELQYLPSLSHTTKALDTGWNVPPFITSRPSDLSSFCYWSSVMLELSEYEVVNTWNLAYTVIKHFCSVFCCILSFSFVFVTGLTSGLCMARMLISSTTSNMLKSVRKLIQHLKSRHSMTSLLCY